MIFIPILPVFCLGECSSSHYIQVYRQVCTGLDWIPRAAEDNSEHSGEAPVSPGAILDEDQQSHCHSWSLYEASEFHFRRKRHSCSR